MSASMAEVIRKALRDHRVVWELTGNPRDIHEAVAKCKSCGYLGSELETYEHQSNVAAEVLAANGFGSTQDARADALQDAANEAHTRGDIGKDGGLESWDFLEWRASKERGMA